MKILRLFVLLTQHHDADEVANDSETACDEGEGATDDWDDIAIIRSLIIFPTGLLDEFCEFISEYKLVRGIAYFQFINSPIIVSLRLVMRASAISNSDSFPRKFSKHFSYELKHVSLIRKNFWNFRQFQSIKFKYKPKPKLDRRRSIKYYMRLRNLFIELQIYV